MANAVQAGDLIGERYQVQSVIGAGGMGVVFEATHLQLRQRVAIKVLVPELCQDPEAVVRFLREARAMVKIESEHVARVTDVGTLGSGEPYIVMEYLEGSDLAELLQKSGRVSVSDAVTYLLQAAEAIAEAHSVGVIHRDLKPSNLFLAHRRDGSSLVKVLDFGISKAVPSVAFGRTSTRTAASVVMGSPLYMPPEQLRSSKSVDPRSDVWSLGVLLHELIVGEPPFVADTLPGLLAKIIADPPTPLRSGRPEAPAALEAVVARCLAKDPAERYQTVSEFAKALQPFAPELERNRFFRTLFGDHPKPAGLSPVNTPRSVDSRTSQAAAPVDTAGGRAAWAAALGPLRTRSFRGALGVLGIVALIGGTLWLARPRERAHGAAVGVQLDGSKASPAARRSGEASPAAALPRSAGLPRVGAEHVKPIVTPLNRARWAALEQATLIHHARLVVPVTPPQTDSLFDDRK